MSAPEVVELQLSDGALPVEQWVYAVVDAGGEVRHVGCTGLPPAVPLAAARVLGVRVPDDVDRRAVRDELARLLEWQDLTRTEPAACPARPVDGPVGALAARLARAVTAASA